MSTFGLTFDSQSHYWYRIMAYDIRIEVMILESKLSYVHIDNNINVIKHGKVCTN